MPTISRFFGIIISMFYNDHNPPHFHAKYGEFEAEIQIDNLALRSGSLPPRVFGFVIEWTIEHRTELLENWDRGKKGQQFIPIAPLQ